MDSAREMEERFAVTAATGALGPVLRKLAALLGDEYKLQEGTRRGIESIKSDLDPVHRLLGKLWWREDLDVACKDWMTEARELSYDMEDGIDLFTLGLERGDDGSFIQQETTDDGPLKEFMERVKDVSKQCGKMQKVGDTICNRSKLTTDPRAFFLHRDASELVGMEEKKEELLGLLQKKNMVCIVGFEGMGKTTLADLVYQTIGDQFQCRAFVSVHPSPNMTEILGAILSQVTDGATTSAGSGTQPAAEQINNLSDISITLSEKSDTEPAAEQNDFMKGISTFLSDKRYLVIIDDIWNWEEWEVIRTALPKNNLDCKLIMTTRIESIAKKCETEQGADVYIQMFGRTDAATLSALRLSKSKGTYVEGELSTAIADMCYWPIYRVCLDETLAQAAAPRQRSGPQAAEIERLDALPGAGSFARPPTKLAHNHCPLAVICLSSAWAESHQVQEGCDGKLHSWARHILYEGFLSTPAMKPLVQSLSVGFDDLPLQLRTCLLYCTIYPPWFRIDRGCLVRKWIAEGFVSQVEVAEAYFDKLVSRNLLQKNAVHPIMRAFLVCKAKEDNFITYDGPGNSSQAKQIRRLSLTSSVPYPDKDVLSQTRSIVVSGYKGGLDGIAFKLRSVNPSFGLPGPFGFNFYGRRRIPSKSSLTKQVLKACKKLRVLEIQLDNIRLVCDDNICLENGHLVDICGLTWLKYLGLNGCYEITELPREIGRLQNLETLHMAGTKISKLPAAIGNLQSLKTLNVSGTKVMELTKEIMNLEQLETLNVSRTQVRELPKEFAKLQHLRTLDIRGTKVRELSCTKDLNPLLTVVMWSSDDQVEKLSSLGIIGSSGGDEATCSEYLSELFLFNHFGMRCQVLPVRMLRVAGRYMKVPQWVKQDLRNVCSLDIRLFELGEKDLEFLKTQMPNLQALQLRFEVLPREPVAITCGGFWKLEALYVDSRLPRVITFEEGAMPKLKRLEFKFYNGTARQDYSMGIKHLDSLDKVVFRCSEYYTSEGPGIRETIEAVRKEAAGHPNEITLWVDGEEPEVFGRAATEPDTEDGDEAFIRKEIEEWLQEIENKEIEHKERERRICEQRLRLSTAAEWRAEREKSNAVIQKKIEERKREILENR